MSRLACSLLAIVALVFLVGCGASSTGGSASFALAEAVPETVAGWQAVDEPQFFKEETLYNLVNGQADAFFAYGFEQVAVRNYQDEAGQTLRLAVWQVATPADAYGLFTTYRSGQPAAAGNGGDTDPGRRLDFWQSRYFVRLFAVQPIPEGALTPVAEAIAAILPQGGAPPALVAQLPQENLVERSPIFFRQEISIQNQLWLGGQNVLGLDRHTAGVLARYTLDGQTAHLLLIEYPRPESAQAGLQGLQQAQLTGLAASQVQGNRLGALFGPVEEAQLLKRALSP